MLTPDWNSVLLNLVGAVTLGVLVPWVVIRLAVKALADSPNAVVTNYRGNRVSLGLGVVWLVWAVAAAMFGSLVGSPYSLGSVSLVPLSLLAAAAFGFGLFDDAFGTSAAKGFRGHVRSLSRGILTTGGLKLIGISVAALAYAAAVHRTAPWSPADAAGGWIIPLATAILAAASIALTGNVLNLMDLRPGRASKVYLLFLAIGFALVVWRLVAGGGGGGSGSIVTLGLAAASGDLLWLAGPVLAVIGLDLKERGMLGDAGANPMGVLAGAYVVGSLGPVGVAIYFVVALALNVVSEKVSFTRVIESNAALSWADNLGRLTDGKDGPRE